MPLRLTILPALACALALLALSGDEARAQVDADLRWVEVSLGLHPDGKATVVYTVRWRVRSGRMHGFYFQEHAGVPHFDRVRSAAEDDAGNRYSLDINQVGSDKWDVLLADGGSVGGGRELTWFLVYGVDLARHGYLGATESEFGQLTYLNWAPVQWDEPLEHYTVDVHYPVEVSGAVDSALLESLNFRTEHWVNENYRMQYFGQPFEGLRVLTVRLHRDGLPERYHFRIQMYIGAEHFGGLEERVEELRAGGRLEQGEAQPLGLFSLPTILVGLLALVGFALIVFKQRRFARAAENIDQFDWELDDWVPPKIQVAQFRNKGKVAELNIYEAGIVCEVPVSAVLALMVGRLEQGGYIRVDSTSPLQITRLKGSDAGLDQYEAHFLDSVGSGGEVNKHLIRSILGYMSDNAQSKAWDCDLEATRRHYTRQFKQAAAEVRSESDLDRQYTDESGRTYPYYYPHYFWYHGRYQDYDRHGRLDEYNRAISTAEPEASRGYAEFISSDACYSACHVQTACHDACHSACHHACHSACHSACHGACHGACVSGGAH